MAILYDMSTFVFPLLLIYVFIRLFYIRKAKINFMRELFLTSFYIYLFSLIFIVWIRGSGHNEQLQYNFIPLKTIIDYIGFNSKFIALQNIIGNILITLPLGFYAVFIFRPFKDIKAIVCFFIFSVTIELGQYLLFKLGLGSRSVDIDDVILNTTGSAAGYYIAKILSLRLNTAGYLNNSRKGL
ncbi:hypothetical protein DNH61_01495 [Paenibacillus sambharensis]|uniref:VanZ-like domain-containing protein n=1 Tax=Paenibacillus sambharensis TaxID=1803190 RepID=A0A2W1LFG0_9BACL|nr:VanZ family protein [Paenibacillus sambharensis]PZD97573.1 hypothetical protein DNH61_01495 [Paenibacillus sambharensis]